jgi:hypothetical protein
MLQASVSPTTGLMPKSERRNRSGRVDTYPSGSRLNSCAVICGVVTTSAAAGALFALFVSTSSELSLGAKHGIFWGSICVVTCTLSWCRSALKDYHLVPPKTNYSSTIHRRINRSGASILDPELFRTAESIDLSTPVQSDDEETAETGTDMAVNC